MSNRISLFNLSNKPFLRTQSPHTIGYHELLEPDTLTVRLPTELERSKEFSSRIIVSRNIDHCIRFEYGFEFEFLIIRKMYVVHLIQFN